MSNLAPAVPQTSLPGQAAPPGPSTCRLGLQRRYDRRENRIFGFVDRALLNGRQS